MFYLQSQMKLYYFWKQLNSKRWKRMCYLTLCFWGLVLEHLVIVHDKPHGSVHSVHRPVIMVGEQFPHLPDHHAWGLIHRCGHCKFLVIPLHAKSITLFFGHLFWNILWLSMISLTAVYTLCTAQSSWWVNNFLICQTIMHGDLFTDAVIASFLWFHSMRNQSLCFLGTCFGTSCDCPW